MAMARSMREAMFLFVAACFVVGAFAEDYDVGDDSGWTVPVNNPNLYRDWARGKTFRVGDVLEFEFQTGMHDVTKVSKSAFDRCTKTNPISQITNGPAKVTLNETGAHYFICTVAQHCSAGQKLEITVAEAGTGPRSAPGPRSGSGSGGTSPGTGSSSSPSAATSVAGGGFIAAMISLVLAMFC